MPGRAKRAARIDRDHGQLREPRGGAARERLGAAAEVEQPARPGELAGEPIEQPIVEIANAGLAPAA